MVYEKLLRVFKEVIFDMDVDISKITLETRIVEDLAFSSINMLLMAIAIESNFDIEIETADIDSFKTVRDVVKYIEERQ